MDDRTGEPKDSQHTGNERPPDPLRRSVTSGTWLALGLLTILLVALIVFIIQNTQKVEISFLGWNGRTPLAAALMIATTAGLIIAGTAGTLRIWQLRRRVRRNEP